MLFIVHLAMEIQFPIFGLNLQLIVCLNCDWNCIHLKIQILPRKNAFESGLRRKWYIAKDKRCVSVCVFGFGYVVFRLRRDHRCFSTYIQMTGDRFLILSFIYLSLILNRRQIAGTDSLIDR